ncbi:MAG: hypothetical protein OEX07_09025 [Gammaproteobacteria bacterium]|nr:hypothetical protein [Gammaproteobacteria bacterium]
MIRFLTLFFLVTCFVNGYANEVKIINVEFVNKGGSSWRVNTTLKHGDTGWDHYADAWRVMTESGKQLGKRVLFHPHEDEQPFTRSLSDLNIPVNEKIVYIEAHDKVHGWSKQRIRVDLNKAKGEGYHVRP